jgi:hypothetical protein
VLPGAAEVAASNPFSSQYCVKTPVADATAETTELGQKSSAQRAISRVKAVECSYTAQKQLAGAERQV